MIDCKQQQQQHNNNINNNIFIGNGMGGGQAVIIQRNAAIIKKNKAKVKLLIWFDDIFANVHIIILKQVTRVGELQQPFHPAHSPRPPFYKMCACPVQYFRSSIPWNYSPTCTMGRRKCSPSTEPFVSGSNVIKQPIISLCISTNLT